MSPSKPRPPHSTHPRPKTNLNPGLDKNLFAYVAAASAAVAMLAAPRSAAAEVVFTPTNTPIEGSSSYLLDLNHDGIPDFTLQRTGYINHLSVLDLRFGAVGNGVAPPAPPNFGAAALQRGAPIGPRQTFTTQTNSYGIEMAAAFFYSVTNFTGPWANATNRYLGLKFLIDGQVHYGWARLTVTNFNQHGTATLTGYAYETQPNVRIFAGERGTGGSVGQAAPAPLAVPPAQPAGLGVLARGADTLQLWRRRQPVLA
jgi:hypothetical protein